MPDSGRPRPATHTLGAPIKWRWVSERGLRIDSGALTLGRYLTLMQAGLSEVEALIPADGSLLVVLHTGASPSARLIDLLAADLPETVDMFGTLHTFLVKYGGGAMEDLTAVAAAAGLNVSDTISLHCSATYRVEFMGFQPGFAYLTGTPTALQQPRLARPRILVPAGSLAIGGAYTGIYPSAGPGGWNLIGHIEARLFDPHRSPPALLRPGDQVRFVAA